MPKWKRKTHNEFINEMLMVNPNIIIIGDYIDAKLKLGANVKLIIMNGNLHLIIY